MRALLMTSLILASCGGQEAIEVQIPVIADSSGIDPVETDLGYSVSILEARAAIRNIEFSIEGEEHESGTMARLWSWLVPTAHAHPGHSAGGEITGELRGDFLIDWMDDGRSLGTARILTGQYQGANFSFRRAEASDGLSAEDPLLGHTFHLLLEVSRDQESWEVEIVLDLEDGTRLIGAPFEHELTESSAESIGLQLLTRDPFEEDTLFDGLDFAPLDDDEDGQIAIVPGQAEHNQLRRLFGAHDFYFARTRQ